MHNAPRVTVPPSIQRPNQIPTRGLAGRCGPIAVALLLTACPGVDSDNESDDEDAVVVVGGYPLSVDDLAALSAADWYWAGDARTFFASSGVVLPVRRTDTEAPPPAMAETPADVLRALALGENPCPDRVEITPMTLATPCGSRGVPASMRGGAMVVFDECELPGGARLSGAFELTSSHTTDDPDCDDDTVVTVEYTSTFTDFSYVTPGGARVVIPTLEHHGRFRHRPGMLPARVDVTTEGRIQRFLAEGDLHADLRVASEHAIEVLPDARGHVSSGTATLEDLLERELDGETPQTLQVISENVRREPQCCRPVAGRLVVSAVADDASDSETWVFGPTCGAATRNGEPDLLPSCP